MRTYAVETTSGSLKYLTNADKGQLHEDNYNFLHGLPTTAKITFWYHRRKDGSSAWHDKAACSLAKPCRDCLTEKARRNCWLNMEGNRMAAAEMLAAPRFQGCILVTPFGKAFFQFAIHRAHTFAASMQQPLFWMQAVGKPPAPPDAERVSVAETSEAAENTGRSFSLFPSKISCW